MKGPKWLREGSKNNLGRWGKASLGGYDTVRGENRHGEALIWCRRCSGCALRRLGPQLVNQCKPEKTDTKDHGQMLQRNSIFEEGGF